jgi:hypothetical protein
MDDLVQLESRIHAKGRFVALITINKLPNSYSIILAYGCGRAGPRLDEGSTDGQGFL